MKMAPRSLLATFFISISLTAFGQDAAMFRGNLAHTGVYNAVGAPKFSQIKWKFHTDGQVISSLRFKWHDFCRQHGRQSVCR